MKPRTARAFPAGRSRGRDQPRPGRSPPRTWRRPQDGWPRLAGSRRRPARQRSCGRNRRTSGRRARRTAGDKVGGGGRPDRCGLRRECRRRRREPRCSGQAPDCRRRGPRPPVYATAEDRRLPTRPCARATDAAAGESHAAFGAPERRQPFHIGSACPRASSKCPISTYGGSSFASPGIPCRSDDYRIVGREGGLDGALGHLGSREVLVQLGGPSVRASQVGAPFCSPQRRAARTDQSG